MTATAALTSQGCERVGEDGQLSSQIQPEPGPVMQAPGDNHVSKWCRLTNRSRRTNLAAERDPYISERNVRYLSIVDQGSYTG